MTADTQQNSSSEPTPGILVRAAPDPSAVTVDVAPELAHAISTACLARAEYFEAYGATQSAASLDGLSKRFVEGHNHGRGVELGVVHLDAAADASEWFAHELIRLDNPSIERVETLDLAVGALRTALVQVRNVFQLTARDGLGAQEGPA